MNAEGQAARQAYTRKPSLFAILRTRLTTVERGILELFGYNDKK